MTTGYHRELLGRCLIISMLMSIAVEWNNTIADWVVWSIFSIILFIWACNIKTEKSK